MRFALAPNSPTLSGLLHISFKQAFLYLTKAEARYRDRRRLDEQPPERLRDMGLTRSTLRPLSPLHHACGPLW